MNADIEKFVRFSNSEFGKKIMKREAEYVYNELRICEKILDVGCGIDDYEKAIKEMARVTKPEGKILVMMLARAHQPSQIPFDQHHLSVDN